MRGEKLHPRGRGRCAPNKRADGRDAAARATSSGGLDLLRLVVDDHRAIEPGDLRLRQRKLADTVLPRPLVAGIGSRAGFPKINTARHVPFSVEKKLLADQARHRLKDRRPTFE